MSERLVALARQAMENHPLNSTTYYLAAAILAEVAPQPRKVSGWLGVTDRGKVVGFFPYKHDVPAGFTPIFVKGTEGVEE